ncbi:MAG: DUF523 domain-containing protein [Deltaproteobacteria bacterium]|nr:DUF523 domain-containing protein [Deltaproteobacteria bacterium]
MILVSACLLGLKTRYDGQSKQCADCLAALTGKWWMPFCPEQLGGLPTPRIAADLQGGNGHDVLAGRGRVITRAGSDVTTNFILGAEEVARLAEQLTVEAVFLRAGSPSCGLHPMGVAAALLSKRGYNLIEFS